MASSEAEKPIKVEKPSSPAPEQTNVHVYPDWAAIQAYYGAGVVLPPPYFNSAVTAGHPPHPYMWGPQPLMPPYGAPYPGMYPHGGIYPHPALSLGPPGHGVPTSPVVGEAMVASPLTLAIPSKSANTKDQSSKKKLKGSNGLVASIGDGNDGSTAGTQSEEDGIEDSSDGSDGNTEAGGDGVQRKRSHDVAPPRGKEIKVDPEDVSLASEEANATSSKSHGGSGSFSGVVAKVETMVPLRTPPALEQMGSSTGKRTTVSTALDATTPARDGLPSELWMKDERALKREKRKQSNRESARRSRLRKQAETEELASKVESLNVENLALKSEINMLAENKEKLRRENTALMEKFKNSQLGMSEETVSGAAEEQSSACISTENFLARVHNTDSVSTNQHLENGVHENMKSGTKLHQLLKSSPRADAVAAG